MTCELIDTHTHLNLGEYTSDQPAVIQNALDCGITRMITPGVTIESCFSGIALAEQYPGIFYSATGIHPQEANIWSTDTLKQLKELSQHPSMVAIGETGLDYYWDTSTPENQHLALRGQIQLAHQCQLPLIIHVRDKVGSFAAYDDLLCILREEEADKIGGVMHCFSGDQAFAEASIELNFYLALGGVLTFKSAHELQQIATATPLQHLVLETDAPWLAPMPYRGKRNEPAYVTKVAEKLAQLKGLPVEEIARATTANASKLFGLPAQIDKQA